MVPLPHEPNIMIPRRSNRIQLSRKVHVSTTYLEDSEADKLGKSSKNTCASSVSGLKNSSMRPP